MHIKNRNTEISVKREREQDNNSNDDMQRKDKC